MNDGAWFGRGSTERESGTDAVQAFTSVAVTVNVNGPAAVGVPASSPAAESVIPLGNAPAVTLHVTGAVPPVCVNWTGA